MIIRSKNLKKICFSHLCLQETQCSISEIPDFNSYKNKKMPQICGTLVFIFTSYNLFAGIEKPDELVIEAIIIFNNFHNFTIIKSVCVFKNITSYFITGIIQKRSSYFRYQ